MIAVALLQAITESGLPIRFSPLFDHFDHCWQIAAED